MTNGFALSHDKSLQIFLFCVKHQAKKNFFERCQKWVSGKDFPYFSTKTYVMSNH